MRFEAVILPDLGTAPGVPIVVSQWFATRGEAVWEGDRLVEVLAGAATFDVPSPTTGRLAVIHRDEDDNVEPGVILGLLAIAEEGAIPDRPRTSGPQGPAS